jgi:hypothetical protein
VRTSQASDNAFGLRGAPRFFGIRSASCRAEKGTARTAAPSGLVKPRSGWWLCHRADRRQYRN